MGCYRRCIQIKGRPRSLPVAVVVVVVVAITILCCIDSSDLIPLSPLPLVFVDNGSLNLPLTILVK